MNDDTEQVGVGLGETFDNFLRESQPGYVVDRGGPTLHLIVSTDGKEMTAYCGDERHIYGPRIIQAFTHPSVINSKEYEQICSGCKINSGVRSIHTDIEQFEGGVR